MHLMRNIFNCNLKRVTYARGCDVTIGFCSVQFYSNDIYQLVFGVAIIIRHAFTSTATSIKWGGACVFVLFHLKNIPSLPKIIIAPTVSIHCVICQ